MCVAIGEREESPNYIQLHIFLDTLNNLFSNEFKIIRKLFVSDFWKFGIITFGQITENRIAYSLFSIGWDKNLKQINTYPESNGFDNFVSDYLSFRGYSNANPVLASPVKHAYERVEEYLKLMLERNLIWPNNQYLQNEYLFYIKDWQFRDTEETRAIDLISLKEQIENYFKLIPYKERKMREFPEMKNNLYRALEYIQNFRIEGKTAINRLSPSQQTLQNISLSVGQSGKFPSNIESMLFDYWNTLLNSYENVLDEFFPLIKEELSNNNSTYIIIPFIDASSFNDRIFNIPYLSIVKFKNGNRSPNRKIFIEINQANVKLDFKKRVILYNEKKYKFSNYENERMSISSLIDDMPIRKGVYNLLTKNLKSYFEKFKEK